MPQPGFEHGSFSCRENVLTTTPPKLYKNFAKFHNGHSVIICNIFAKVPMPQALSALWQTCHFYTTDKNKRNMPGKFEIKKFDPVVRKHVMYKEAKIK